MGRWGKRVLCQVVVANTLQTLLASEGRSCSCQLLANVPRCAFELESDRFSFVGGGVLDELERRDRALRLQARHEGRTAPYAGEQLKTS